MEKVLKGRALLVSHYIGKGPKTTQLLSLKKTVPVLTKAERSTICQGCHLKQINYTKNPQKEICLKTKQKKERKSMKKPELRRICNQEKKKKRKKEMESKREKKDPKEMLIF